MLSRMSCQPPLTGLRGNASIILPALVAGTIIWACSCACSDFGPGRLVGSRRGRELPALRTSNGPHAMGVDCTMETDPRALGMLLLRCRGGQSDCSSPQSDGEESCGGEGDDNGGISASGADMDGDVRDRVQEATMKWRQAARESEANAQRMRQRTLDERKRELLKAKMQGPKVEDEAEFDPGNLRNVSVFFHRSDICTTHHRMLP